VVAVACFLSGWAKELSAATCTVYGTQKVSCICIITSFTPLSNAWKDVLGIYFVKETV
jgi:hypothetical protein